MRNLKITPSHYVEGELKKDEVNMSEEGGFGLIAAEKFFGLILFIVGALATYYTFTSTQALRDYTGFFGFLSLTLLVLGIILITAKTE